MLLSSSNPDLNAQCECWHFTIVIIEPACLLRGYIEFVSDPVSRWSMTFLHDLNGSIEEQRGMFCSKSTVSALLDWTCLIINANFEKCSWFMEIFKYSKRFMAFIWLVFDSKEKVRTWLGLETKCLGLGWDLKQKVQDLDLLGTWEQRTWTWLGTWELRLETRLGLAT